MKKAVYYVRISTKSKEGKQSVDSQIPIIDKYCKISDLQIINGYKEEESGILTHDQRPQLTELLEFIKVNDVGALVVVELSRLGRSVSDLFNIIKLLTARSVCLHAINDQLKTLDEDGKESFMGKIMISIIGICAEMEREKIIDRTTRGLAYSAKYLNRWTGGVLLPYGYHRVEKVLTIEEEEAVTIRDIFNMVLEGMGTTQIADKLNTYEVKTRYNKALKNPIHNKRTGITSTPDQFYWKDAVIHKILTNPIYKGVRMYKGEALTSPAIIDPELFDKVQSVLHDRFSKKDGNIKHFYLLRDIKLICGKCGQSYYPHKRSDGKDNRYVCLSKRYKNAPKCNNTGIGIDKLNSGIWWVIRRTDDLKHHIEQGINKSDVIKIIVKLETELKKIDKDLEKCINQERFIVKMVSIGKMSEDIYTEQFDQIKDTVTKFKKQREEVVAEIANYSQYKKENINLNAVIRDIKDDKHLMREQINQLVKSITFYPVSIKLGKIKDDKVVLIKMFLKMSPNPLYFCISQRSDYVLPVAEKNIDFTNFTINETALSKKELITYFIKS